MRIERQYKRLEKIKYTFFQDELKDILIKNVKYESPKGGAWSLDWTEENGNLEIELMQQFTQDIPDLTDRE